MRALLRSVIGPRVGAAELDRDRTRFALPALALAVARILLLSSVFLPYWSMVLEAPQYPDGLELVAYVNRLEGDVAEIDGLNHYIGMRPLNEAASMERAASVWMVIAMAVFIELAATIRSKWAALLALPVLMYPFGFLLDLQFWLWSHGSNLDPRAPLSSSVQPFVPPALGIGTIGQFRTLGVVEIGWWFACASSAATLVGLWFHRRAYKPLNDAMRGGGSRS